MDIANDFEQFRMINSIANEVGVRPELVHAVIQRESGGRQGAVSPKGAIGIMQVMPATAANPGLGVQPFDPNDPQQNVRGGVSYLKALLNRYGGNEAKALAAYNAGPGRVDAGGPLPQETQDYVPAVAAKAGSIGDDFERFRTGKVDNAATQIDKAPVVGPATNPATSAGPVERFAEGAWQNLNPMGIVHAIAHPIDTAENIVGAQVDQFKKAKADYDAGHYSEMLGHGAAGLLPVIGPAAAHAGETIGKGENIAGGLGEAAGLVGSLEAPKVVKGIATKARVIPEMVMDSALKPDRALRLKNPDVNFARTALDEGISATDRGMQKATGAIEGIEAEKAKLFAKYGLEPTDFSQRAVDDLMARRADVAQGAAPAQQLAEIDNLVEQIRNHPNFSAPQFQTQLQPRTVQANTGATGNNGLPIMQTQTVQVPTRVQTGRALTAPPVEDVVDAYKAEAQNTRGKYGIQNVAQGEETIGRKTIRNAASTSLKTAIDPLVQGELNSRTPLQRVADAVRGRQQTFSELQKRESSLTALRRSLVQGQARRNNLNPLSLTAQVIGGSAGAATGGFLGAGAGALFGQLVAKPGGLSLIARTLNVPVETVIRIAQLGAPAGVATVAGNTRR